MGQNLRVELSKIQDVKRFSGKVDGGYAAEREFHMERQYQAVLVVGPT